MGKIADEREKKRRKSTNEPLNKFGKTERNTNDFDIDEKTIKDQKNKE